MAVWGMSQPWALMVLCASLWSTGVVRSRSSPPDGTWLLVVRSQPEGYGLRDEFSRLG